MARSSQADKGHLLVVRLSAMGDVAIAVPVLEALRRSYPDLRITVLTRRFFKPFFREIERIEFFSPDFDCRHKGLAGLLRLAGDLKRLDIDMVADLHDVLRTKVLRMMFRAFGWSVATIDKGSKEKKSLVRSHLKVVRPLKPTIERYRETIEALGLTGFVPELPVEKRLQPIPKGMLAAAKVRVKAQRAKWIGVAPFAQHRGKVYPLPLMAELIAILAMQYERLFIFGGGPYEREFAEYMEGQHKNVASVIGRIKLAEELDLISNLDCMVTMDSSAMHMASLMSVPVVSIWGATHPFAGFYGYGQELRNAVQSELPCRPCSVYGNQPCIFGDYRCMHAIAPSTIADMVAKVTGRRR
ncbi:MAG: glycosyltransferase family 9 protein [Rikenellaceae bacterium]|jgi:ADP-heptose:LPS heptosyltransferase|nr:glycosyltransferase family 9 protein [Rikenellaceae bacterium]